MFNMVMRIKNFIKHRRWFMVIGAIILLGIGGYKFLGGNSNTDKDFVTVRRGDVRQAVNVTGRVRAAQNVDLAFEKAGRVVAVFADVGIVVVPGQSLVALSGSDLAADLERAKAEVLLAEAKLSELKRGARQEDIQVSEVQLTNARAVQEDAKVNLVNQVQEAYTQVDDAIRNKVDQLFTNPRSSSPRLIFTSDTQLQIDIESGRTQVESILAAWSQKQAVISSQDAKQNLQKIKLFLDKVALAVNTQNASSNISQTTLDAYKAAILASRGNINTAIESISTADEKLRNADSALSLAQQQLTLKKAVATVEQIASGEAEVARANANVRSAEAQFAKTVLRAPIHGVVTRQDSKIGQIVSANTAVVSIAGVAEFQVEVNMPEADIAKIAVGQGATITLDAYSAENIFEASVVKIDPAETMVDGVATYKATLQFAKNDARIKSGMTANAIIVGEIRKNVLFVPQRAVLSKDGQKIVRVTDGESIKEVIVATGLRGSDGSLEILSGAREGDKVLTTSVIK